ncbi:MAG: hypothetical protein ACFFDW_02560 [Candidatus Thorarchaeota archaeon]
MEYESSLSPSDAIKKAEDYFENEVLNHVIKEKPLSKKDKQLLEIGVTGGRWEVFWMKIAAARTSAGITKIAITSRPGLAQLSFGAIVLLLSGPFIYLSIANDAYWVLFFPIFLFIIGLLSIIMPLIRMRETGKALKEVLTEKREIKKKKQQ